MWTSSACDRSSRRDAGSPVDPARGSAPRIISRAGDPPRAARAEPRRRRPVQSRHRRSRRHFERRTAVSQDPLTAFVARSLRAEVTDVRSEIVTKNAALELERIRFRQEGDERSLVVKRVPPSDALEVQLLPLLARKTDRVPIVRSRGIPPPAVPAWPWLLTDELIHAPRACHGDPAAIVRANPVAERAVANDEPPLLAV